MNNLQIGHALRALRHRLGWRQVDLAAHADVSQQLVSLAELGRIANVSHGALRRMFGAVDADVVTLVRWRGGELDRLLDEDHASVVAAVCRVLVANGWQVFPEVSFAIYGERGSIDILAWHAETRTLLVIEVKTEIASAEELLRRHDTKVRLAPRIAGERFDLRPKHVGRLLVVAETSTNRRRVERLDPMLRPVYPERGAEVRAWLRHPSGELNGLLFTTPERGTGARRRRVHTA